MQIVLSHAPDEYRLQYDEGQGPYKLQIDSISLQVDFVRVREPVFNSIMERLSKEGQLEYQVNRMTLVGPLAVSSFTAHRKKLSGEQEFSHFQCGTKQRPATFGGILLFYTN